MKFLAAVGAAWALCAGAASLQNLETRGTTPGLSQDYSDRPTKYFLEHPSHVHYDRRFTKKILAPAAQRDAIRVLVQTYLSTFRDLGVQTWLMHGTLLGWWWGKKIMPWDFDADVQVSEADMFFLAAYHNMTTWYYRYDGAPEGRHFLLEVNPHFVHRETNDRLNVIDARWIDTTTGLFIDITAARYSIGHPRGEGMLYDKNYHEYRDTYLYPLLDSTFEGVPVKIPYGYRKMLESEYGDKALKRTQYHDHIFDTELMQWVSEVEEEEEY